MQVSVNLFTIAPLVSCYLLLKKSQLVLLSFVYSLSCFLYIVCGFSFLWFSLKRLFRFKRSDLSPGTNVITVFIPLTRIDLDSDAKKKKKKKQSGEAHV